MPTTFQINLFLSQGKNEPNTKKQFWNVMKRCLKTALCKCAEDLASRDLHPSSSCISFSLEQPKESIAPRTLHDHSKAFVCLQWPLKSRSPIPHSCFLLLFKKKEKRKLFWCKRERPVGTRINGDKETWRLAFFSTPWPLIISGCGQTLWSLCS